jgi:hypothetical protein
VSASLVHSDPGARRPGDGSIKRWENEDVLDRMQDGLDRMPEAMGVRRQTVEHPFGTLKA